jgi:acetyl esterase/lipase
MTTRTRIVRTGSSKGIRIPRTLLDEADLPGEVEVHAQPGRLVVQAARRPHTEHARTKHAARRYALATKTVGGALSFSALAMSSAQFYRISSATLGPGAFMLSIPKILGASLAPLAAVAGGAGAALALSALWSARRRISGTEPRPGSPDPSSAAAASLPVMAGVTAATLSVLHTKQIVASRGNFAEAFGPDWQDHIPSGLKSAMLRRPWTWKLSVAPGAHVERDLPFSSVPGTNRQLLADVWSPADGIAHSGLGFIYLHGGGYTAFDKGGPTETWFRHLAEQGHVVMDVSYRLIPETNVPGMVGDVKRAVAWLKRNALRYGLNPDRIVLGGGSAGSHLALLAAYAPDHPLLTPADVREADLSVRGVVGYYNAGDCRFESRPAVTRTALQRTVARFLTHLLEAWSASEIAVDETGEWDPQLFVGGRPDEWPELYRQISPIVHVNPDTPPTMQLVGGHDVYVSRSGSVPALHRRLLEAGVSSVYVEFPRTDHAFDLFLPKLSPAAQTAMYDVDRFLALMASPVEWRRRVSPAGAVAPQHG